MADHGYGAIYGQAPALTLIQALDDYGKKAVGVDIPSLIQSSDLLRRERKIYEPFESPFRGHDPTVAAYKLTGGAVGSAFEQADKGGFLERLPEILTEMARVQAELGNWWSVTPGSQILWTTAVNNVLHGRYERPSLDLKNLLLGRYGPLPFFKPEAWICEKVLEFQRYDGKKWPQILAAEGGMQKSGDADLKMERRRLEGELDRPASDEDLVLYLQFPFDALSFFKFRGPVRQGLAAAAGGLVPAGRLQGRRVHHLRGRIRGAPPHRGDLHPPGRRQRHHHPDGGPQFPNLQRPGGRPP